MNEANPSPENRPSASPPPSGRPSGGSSLLNLNPRARLHGCVGCILLAAVAFSKPLVLLADHALRVDLDSYILLVPFISAYLLYINAKKLPRNYFSSPGWAAGFAAVGSAALAAGWNTGAVVEGNGASNYLTWTIFAFLCWIAAIELFFLGRNWLAKAAFPVAFLVFMIPLPAQAVEWLENGSKFASAEVAGLFFNLSGTPNLRDGLFFQLPNIAIEVAQECSGIRSSLVLFVTSLLAAHLFLRSNWRRALLIALVIPLGFLRNGFRIWTLGQLCVYLGPHMIHSIVHTRGGPVFFALSLLPLFLLIWWLRRGEHARDKITTTRLT